MSILLVSRDEARAQGLKRYFTGKSCRNGHFAERYVHNTGCSACQAGYLKTWRAENPERTTRYRKKHPVRALLNNIKSHAKRDDIPFDLEFDDVVIPEICPVLGIPLDRRDRNHTPSIDKYVPSIGYVKGNIDVISLKTNRLKNNGTLEDSIKIVEYMKKKE